MQAEEARFFFFLVAAEIGGEGLHSNGAAMQVCVCVCVTRSKFRDHMPNLKNHKVETNPVREKEAQSHLNGQLSGG